MSYGPAYTAFSKADDAWQMELVATFGKEAGDARFEPRGEGQPGTKLRAAYEARDAARKAWEVSRKTA